MLDSNRWVVAGLDSGGTTINATVLDSARRFLVDEMAESPSCVREGPAPAIEALAQSLDDVLERTGVPRENVRAVGLDTPGPVTSFAVWRRLRADNPVRGSKDIPTARVKPSCL